MRCLRLIHTRSVRGRQASSRSSCSFSPVVDFLEPRLRFPASVVGARGTPNVTLTYAQSIDGCLCGPITSERQLISGEDSMVMTHQFRTMHDAILIGVGTLLSDDPQLTARLVPGPSPQPVVLDSNLRTPLTSALVRSSSESTGMLQRLTLLTTSNGPKDKWERAKALDQRGVFILEVPAADGRVSLEDALCRVKEDLGCHSVMVEGGMTVIASFLARPELVSNLVVTVSPKFLGGYGPSAELLKGEPQSLLSIPKMQSCPVGDDIVLYGSPSVPYLNGNSGDAHKPKVNGHSHLMQTQLSSSCRMWVEAIESECDLKVYNTPKQGQEIVALIKGDVFGGEHVPVRVHSECFTGDVLGSKRCDCGPQLRGFLDILQQESAGILLYIRGDEGRGIGLVEKIRAYELQEKGLDTIDANLSLGHAADLRTFESSKEVLQQLGVQSIKLYTNNPEKVEALRPLAREVRPLKTVPNKHNVTYLQTKRDRLNHKTILSELPI